MLVYNGYLEAIILLDLTSSCIIFSVVMEIIWHRLLDTLFYIWIWVYKHSTSGFYNVETCLDVKGDISKHHIIFFDEGLQRSSILILVYYFSYTSSLTCNVLSSKRDLFSKVP